MYMKKLLLFAVVLVAFIGRSFGAASPIYTYATATTGAPTYYDGNLSTYGSLTAIGTGTNTPCSSGFSGITGFTATSYATTNPCVEVHIAAASGFTISISGMTVGLRASTTGPTAARLAYSIDGGTTWIDDGTNHIPRNGSCGTVDTAKWLNQCITCTDFRFRVYPFGASNPGGTLQIMGLDLLGVVVATSSITPPTIAAAGPTRFCSGGNVTLNAPSSASYTYQWYNGTTRIPGATRFSYTANATGNYWCYITGPVFCSDTTNVIAVTVNTPPPAPTVTPSGARTICSFDSVVISGPAGYTYQWYDGFTAITGATDMTYTARTRGNYRVTITDTNGCTGFGFSSLNLSVLTAAPGTLTTTGSLSFCSGDSVRFTAATGTGYTYQWYNGTTAITGATTNRYTAYHSGTYYVAITSTNGCITNSTNYVVTEVTTPVITAGSDTVFCAGGNVRLTINTAGASGIYYQWKKDGVNISGATSTSYIATITGTYVCVINVPGSCTASSNGIRVTSNPIPTPIITFSGTTLRVQNYYRSYQWYLNTITIPGATTYNTTARSNGSYRVFVTDTNGCTKLSNEYAL
ncbi:MAG: hypothetical protein EBZ77_12670, partial [Chitinophagia bacterium]|nr:hypothetical protein [Chitinophagia bacterium]